MTPIFLLEKAGYNPVLRIGVATQERNFGVHAWIEMDGEPLGEADDVSKRFKADWCVETSTDRRVDKR